MSQSVVPPQSAVVPLFIQKRDGRELPFALDKITEAISKAFLATHFLPYPEESERMAKGVAALLHAEGGVPDVEHVQDLVEQVLIESGYVRTAKAYIFCKVIVEPCAQKRTVGL